MDGASHLPSPVAHKSPHIRCRCREGSAQALAQDISIHAIHGQAKAVDSSGLLRPSSHPNLGRSKSEAIDVSDDDDPEFWNAAQVVAAQYDEPGPTSARKKGL